MKTTILFSTRILCTAIFLYSLILLSGCSSTKGILSFNTLQYPASMSAFLYDQNQDVAMKGRELDSLFSFKIKKTYWSLAYGLIPLTKGESISDSLNAIVEQYKGDGIINLTVTIDQGVVNKIYSFFLYLPSYIPIIPSSADITVTGEVVKLIRPGTSDIFDDKNIKNYVPKENIYSKINETLHEFN
jgi:hypothetical protein